MLGVPLDTRVRRILGISVDDGLALTINDTPTVYFAAHLNQPQGDNGLLDGSPRTSLSPWRLYWQGPIELAVCDRIEAPDETVYELISKPKPLQNGRSIIGYSAPCLPVDQLYPRSAELKDMGKPAVIATVECAVYSERESKSSRGAYIDTFADLPPAAWEHIDGARNRELHFGDGSVWKITEATLAPELPYVNASVRKAA